MRGVGWLVRVDFEHDGEGGVGVVGLICGGWGRGGGGGG